MGAAHEPYVGMRIVLREGERTATVTRPSSVDASAKNKAQLECQRSLWRPGDVVMTDVTPGSATVVVRDWGLTSGSCRHQDTKASAIFAGVDGDVLRVAVTRGKATAIQEWTRVR